MKASGLLLALAQVKQGYRNKNSSKHHETTCHCFRKKNDGKTQHWIGKISPERSLQGKELSRKLTRLDSIKVQHHHPISMDSQVDVPSGSDL